MSDGKGVDNNLQKNESVCFPAPSHPQGLDPMLTPADRRLRLVLSALLLFLYVAATLAMPQINPTHLEEAKRASVRLTTNSDAGTFARRLMVIPVRFTDTHSTQELDRPTSFLDNAPQRVLPLNISMVSERGHFMNFAGGCLT